MSREGAGSRYSRGYSEEAEKTRNIHGKSTDVEPSVAKTRAEPPYKHTDNPVRAEQGYKTVDNIESHHADTKNPLDIMIDEEEAEPDRYAEYNAQGDTRPPQRDWTWDDHRKSEEYFQGIEKLAEGLEKQGENKFETEKNNLRTELKGNEELVTPAQMKANEKAAKSKEEIYKPSDKKRGKWRKPISTNRPSGIRKILGK